MLRQRALRACNALKKLRQIAIPRRSVEYVDRGERHLALGRRGVKHVRRWLDEVCFTRGIGHRPAALLCPPCANSGHSTIHSITSSAQPGGDRDVILVSSDQTDSHQHTAMSGHGSE
jgi:hypothetical protein